MLIEAIFRPILNLILWITIIPVVCVVSAPLVLVLCLFRRSGAYFACVSERMQRILNWWAQCGSDIIDAVI